MMPMDPAPPVVLAPNLWIVRNRVFASNTYVVVLEDPKKCLIIDPGLDHAALDMALDRLHVHPVAVFCTHGHFDHIGGAARLKEAFGATLHVHTAERKTVQTANFTMMLCKVAGRITIPAFDIFADETESYLTGPDAVRFLHTPGHSAGSALVLWRDVVFTGDTLFRDVIGLESFPGEDATRLKESLIRVWNGVSDASLVCPGHGKVGRFGEIKHENTALRAFLGAAVTGAAAASSVR